MPPTTRPVLLLVDDEASILTALRRTLRGSGFAIETASSADAALRRLERGDVAAVLSDQKMPGRSGVELLRVVARRWPNVARVLLTGWPEEVPPAVRAELGLRALLPKPWDADALRALLGTLAPAARASSAAR